MRLVKLEIKGFKSFAKETVLHFREDVIGVVGPNGSGKSNIVDAIRWVLGEQKKGELRLDKMSSVIFNGTKRRKAGNVAQVFLTFDNDRGVLRSDFQTVTIGRLLYRNGDSEYRLNGVACRRKDITDLFVDTGIESNSYSIIALGMVDDILADKDNSRLRMLEQAAGISVYKVRKKETLSRLERTQEDLDRVADLLHEIDGQLSSLEKQARRTKQYFALREEYKGNSLDYAYLSSRSLQQQRRDVAEELERAEAFAKTKVAELADADQQLTSRREEQFSEEQHLAEQRRQLGSVQAKLRTAISDKQLAEQKLAYLSQNLDKLGEQQAHATRERERLTADLERRETQVSKAEQEEAAFAKTLIEAQAAHEAQQAKVADLRGSARENAERLQAAERALLDTDKQLAVLQSRLDTIVQETRSRAQRRDRAAQQQHDLAAADIEASHRVEQFQRQLAQSEAQELARAKEQQTLRDELDLLAPQLRQLASDRQRVGNEAAMLQAALERAEGSSQSDKYLAIQLGWKERYPQFGDLLHVDDAYRPAVESALAELLGAFVVPDAATAAEGLRVLAEAAQPQTTILFLTATETPTTDIPALVSAELTTPPTPASDERHHVTQARAGSAPTGSHRDGLAPAPPDAVPLLEHVTVEPAYRQLLARVCDGLYVVRSATQLAATPPGQRRTDVEGRQLWSAWSARGGMVSAQLGRQTGRRQRLADLRVQLEALSAEADQLDLLRGNAERHLQELRAEHDPQVTRQLRQRLQQAEREAATASARLDSLASQQNDERRLDAGAAARISALEADLAELSERRAPQVLARSAAEESVRAFEDTNRDAAAALIDASTAFNAANLRAIQLQNHAQSTRRERDYVLGQLHEVERALADSRAALGNDGSEVGELEARIVQLGERIETGTETRAAQESRLGAGEADFYARRSVIVELEKRERVAQQQLSEGQALLARLRERRAELGFRLEALAERLRIEFNLDLAAATTEEREVTGSLADLEARLLKQKQRLDTFGEINPLAVEAYDAMSERRGGIAAQKADIEAAMTDLRQTVAEIDQTATTQLLQAFDAVRGHFVEVFRHLFDAEDTADMVMLNPEEPLDSKIEIVAKPKGKRPQTISQLSGGEKTLTATAFLFALYLIKPAPFCIFDEVDAPLDDANVEKFNRIIKRFSKGSQFIIVTHNKLTMAAVDTIYGVYMPELGVSEVAPVDFRQFEHSDLLELVG